MPKGGVRNKKPTRLKVIQGTFRPDRARNEPRPAPIAPPMPRGIDPLAKRMWKYLAPTLEKHGLLTAMDGPMFELLCEAWSRWEHSRRHLSSVRKKTKSRKSVRMAEVSVEKAEQSFRLLCNEFGLTPAARGRLNISAADADEDDEFEAFLNQSKQRSFSPKSGDG